MALIVSGLTVTLDAVDVLEANVTRRTLFQGPVGSVRLSGRMLKVGVFLGVLNGARSTP